MNPSTHELSRGFIQSATTHQSNLHEYRNPLVQVFDFKLISNPGQQQGHPTSTPRYRSSVSDGQHYIQTMFGNSASEYIANGLLQQYSIIRIKEYTMNVVSSKQILIILVCDIVDNTVPQIIGNPINANTLVKNENNMTTSGSASAIKREPLQSSTMNNIPSYMNNTSPSKGAIMGTNSGAIPREFNPINSLNPYQTRWTIKARVTAKSDMKAWNNQRGEGKLFSVDLLDASGGQIRATMFKDAAEKFFSVFDQDNVYVISKGILKLANKKFSRLPNEYEITLNSDAEVIKVEDDMNIQSHSFTFTPISEISHIEPNQFVDVIGVVTSVGGLSTINSQKTQRELKKRTLTITDNTLSSIEVTLWNDFAQGHVESELEGNPVIAVKQVRVSDFAGRTLGTTFQSQVFVNPDVADAHRLKAWWQQNPHQHDSSSIAQLTRKADGSGNFVSSGGGRVEQRSMLESVVSNRLGHGDKPDYVTCRATITYIRQDFKKPPWYTACPGTDCNKKVVDTGNGNFHCEKCQREYPNCIPRYILSVMISDSTAPQWVSMFNEHAEIVLGVKAAQLATYVADDDQQSYNRVFADASFKQYIIKFRAKAEMQQDEQKVRCQVVDCKPLNYVNETKLLLDEINRYG